MKVLAFLLLIAAAHIAFLFGGYGTGLLGLAPSLPDADVLTIWLGVSSVLAAFGYFKIGSAWPRLSKPILPYHLRSSQRLSRYTSAYFLRSIHTARETRGARA
jgi:hypothetical protein